MLRPRRKANPKEEAIQFSLNNKDRNGFEIRFINDVKGRGVFSCTEFEKGDFLLEYRGDLISKEECERRQRIYHKALKVFMFEFRFNGKFICVGAARDDGSLGRLVNDDHINPNCRMKTIRVDGKPHLCLFAIRSICPGEEITYNYGDSEWPWRCKVFKSS
ncbi:N-lysine methyltransferase KMT5A-A [Triplophysa tibetana]|uniref:N-lysine methyltransferase KMT5A-A n=1 Tax=Triplophysa tibetana TaxID=1572043 RepID=A0A5A9NTU1_9TELE|nr:N-lysine methyltransferase KMT5A-A [Triplophysa tibetana]